MKLSYDPACEKLARHFLTDEAQLHHLHQQLAQAIQDAVETWLDDKRHELREILQ